MSKILEAVVEIYSLENFEAWNSVKNSKPLIRLWKDTTFEETGSVIAQIAAYNQINITLDKKEIINNLINKNGLVVGGGLKTVENDKFIIPSCCCGLEGWNEWLLLSPEFTGVWLGHDPSPYIEFVTEKQVYEVWSNGNLGESSDKSFSIEFSTEEMRKALNRVSQDLKDFIFVLDSWAKDLFPKQSDKLVETFKTNFHIE